MLNPLFKIHDVVLMQELPKTATNKIMRRVLRQKYLDRQVRKLSCRIDSTIFTVSNSWHRMF